MAAEADFEALGLLDGLPGDARQERVDLIAWLLDRDFDLDHIRGSLGAPLNLPSSRVIGDDGTYVSAREICHSAGIDLAFLQRIHRAIGLPRIEDPDAPNLSRADGEAAAQARIILDLGIDPEDVIAVLRVMSESLGHTAAVMREAALKSVLKPGATEIEVAEALELLALRAAPTFGPMMEALLRLELRRSFAIEAVTAAERAAGILPGARPVTVCFADLTGFTMLGEALPPEDLERVANRLAELAHDVSAVPVRFVKSIGDAVMLVSFEPIPLVDVVLDLADAAAANDLPPLRIGIASGCAVSRAGDWFGSPVNVASRVTAAAGPGSVLATASTRDAIGTAGDFEWSSIGARQLRGVSGEVKLFRVQRAVSHFTSVTSESIVPLHPIWDVLSENSVTEVLITRSLGSPFRSRGEGRNMDLPGVNAHRESDIPITSASQLLTTSSICPACGYPALNMDLCAYCRPLTKLAV